MMRRTLLAGHMGAGLCSLAIAVLFSFGLLSLGLITGLVAVGAICLSIHSPAFTKLTTLMMPPEQLGRANGLGQLTVACGYLVAPLLASILMPIIDMVGILAIDITSFVFAIVVILVVRLRETRSQPREEVHAEVSSWRDVSFGWRYVYQRPGLMGVVVL